MLNMFFFRSKTNFISFADISITNFWYNQICFILNITTLQIKYIRITILKLLPAPTRDTENIVFGKTHRGPFGYNNMFSYLIFSYLGSMDKE